MSDLLSGREIDASALAPGSVVVGQLGHPYVRRLDGTWLGPATYEGERDAEVETLVPGLYYKVVHAS